LRVFVAWDRMDLLYRVGLIPLAVNHSQDAATVNFLDAYLNRDPACVACHTTKYSTTDPIARNGQWDRFHPIPYVDIEGSAFTWDNAGSHYGGAGGTQVYDNIHGFFRDDAYLAANGKHPFGIDASCVTGNGRRGFDVTIASDATQRVGFAGINGNSYGPLKLIDTFSTGVAALYDPDFADPPIYPGADPGDDALLHNGCAGCHFPANGMQAPENLYTHTRYMAPWRIEDIIKNGSPSGLMVGYTPPDLTGVVAHLTNPARGYVGPRFHLKRDASFAQLVAMKVAGNVFDEMAGYDLTIDHGVARNAEAAGVLASLTHTLVDNQWSLKALVREIALSDWANRRAPADSFVGPYQMPLFFDMWADVLGNHPDATTGEDRNGQGQLVHRRSIPQLLVRVEKALGWPAQPAVSSALPETWVDQFFLEEVGAFVDLTHPGFRGWVLAAMLAYEGEVGRCAMPPGVTSDYVSELTDAANGLTVEQAARALKMRLVGVDDFWPGESTLLADLTGGDLARPASGEADGIRDYCAALLQSPDFVLTGLPALAYGEDLSDPDPDVPCVDDLCTWDEYCEYYRDEAVDLGYGEMDCDLGLTVRP
jgi:hypothetical protein